MKGLSAPRSRQLSLRASVTGEIVMEGLVPEPRSPQRSGLKEPFVWPQPLPLRHFLGRDGGCRRLHGARAQSRLARNSFNLLWRRATVQKKRRYADRYRAGPAGRVAVRRLMDEGKWPRRGCPSSSATWRQALDIGG